MSTTVAATFVFTDLVDSTALSSSVSAVEADALRRAHFASLRTVVSATGGVEVKNLGDGLMVVFSSPSRALACAVGMQQSVDAHNARASVPLAIRVGVATGEAVEEDGDYFGPPVVEAARLCAEARGGQILATQLVRLLIGRNATFQMVPVGALALKGLPEPVEAVDVAWEPEDRAASEGTWPVPDRLVRGATESAFGFFGRADAMAQLAAAGKDSAAEQHVHLVLISGEPGVGKTTLASHAALGAHGAHANVTFGSCEDGLSVPFGPWIGALRHLVEHCDPDAVSSLPVMHRQALMRLVPEIDGEAAPAPDTENQSEQFVLFEAVAKLLCAAARDRPLLVVLDDLHWADAGTIQLLRHLVTSGRSMSVLILVTYRDSDLARAHPLTSLVADMHREQPVSRVSMSGLTDADLISLMEAAAGHELGDDGVQLAHALRRETEGNPFFVAEMLRHLGETGEIYLDDRNRYVLRTSLAEIGLPTSVRDVVARRVARLGDETDKVLAMAAVIGRDFDVDVLARVASLEEDRLIDILDQAVSAAVLTESTMISGRFRFAHALIQHTLYQDLSATRRQRLHQRIAEILEDQHGDTDAQVPELAYHWIAATRPADAERALHYAARAGDLALAALALSDAADWYRQSLDLLDRLSDPDDHRRCALLVGLGRAQTMAADGEARATLLDAGAIAQRIGASDLLIASALAARRGSFSPVLGEDVELTALTDAALAAVGETDTPDRVRLLSALTEHTRGGDWQLARQRALAAVEAARRVGDDRLMMEAVASTATACQQPDVLEERLADTERALAIADVVGSPLDRVDARFNRMQALLEAVEANEAGRLLVEVEQIASSVDLTLPFARLRLLIAVAGQRLLVGDHAGAERAGDELLALSALANVPDALVAYGALLITIRFEQGRTDEMIELYAAAIEQSPELSVLRALIAFLYSDLGRLDDARALMEVDRASDFELLPYDVTWTTGMTLYADCAVLLGDVDVASTIRERVLPFAAANTYNALTSWGVVSRPLGCIDTLLGNFDAAEREFRDAIDLNARMGAPFLVGRAQLDYAMLLCERGLGADHGHAASLARDVVTAADRHGYGGLNRRATGLLARLSGELP